LDLVFGALSDRTRRALLLRLVRAPAKITDLAEPFEMSLPAVSKHVRVLERAGLVRRTVDGRVHRCFFDAAPLEAADEWIARHRVFWEQGLESLAEFVAKNQG
jgi:DNA-binding transcriptional ArsR family regulator